MLFVVPVECLLFGVWCLLLLLIGVAVRCYVFVVVRGRLSCVVCCCLLLFCRCVFAVCGSLSVVCLRLFLFLVCCLSCVGVRQLLFVVCCSQLLFVVYCVLLVCCLFVAVW